MSFQQFQKAPNRLSSQEIIFLIISGVVISLVLYGLAVGNRTLAGYLPQGGEFSLLRTAGRAFLFDRIEPYSGTIPALVQEQVFGRVAVSGEEVYILDIPFHLLIFFLPLALFPDASIAQTFWMALSEIAGAVFIYFSFRLIDRRNSPVFIALIAIAGFTSYYALRSFFEGSPVILLALLYVAVLLALRANFDELSGALMTLAAFQWEIGGLFLLFVVLWVSWERRWRVFAGAGMLAFVLFILSFFIYPGWIMPFLRAAWNSLRVGFGFSTHDIFEKVWPQYGDLFAWVSTATLLILLGYEWRASRGKHFAHFIWVSCLTLAATPLFGQHVEMDHLFPLTLPIMLVIIILRERWNKLGDAIAILLLGFYFGLPWVLSYQGLPEGIGLDNDEVLFLIWPVFTVIGLYWIRWWMVRPPRTWLDNFARKEHG